MEDLSLRFSLCKSTFPIKITKSFTKKKNEELQINLKEEKNHSSLNQGSDSGDEKTDGQKDRTLWLMRCERPRGEEPKDNPEEMRLFLKRGRGGWLEGGK